MRDIRKFLDQKAAQYNCRDFIPNDPVSIPHLFEKKQDIEIMGLFASVFAWGQRITIIRKCEELIDRMQGEPYRFILNHTEKDLKKITGFKHRTFNDTDLLYFIYFLRTWYQSNESLETAFSAGMKRKDTNVENGLNHFRHVFFNGPDFPKRTLKHIASPQQHSACKRLNMYLRWMVRQDTKGVDFGIWKNIKPSQLICPLDLHVQRVALKLGILNREQSDWKAAVELTTYLKTFDASDPVKYDFALFGLGVEREF